MKKRKAFNVFVLYLIIILLSACGGSTTEVKTGSLELSIQGLTALDADVTVTGPNSFNQTLKASGKLENLAAGDYTITAQDIVQTDTHFPDKRKQNVVIKAGESSSVSIIYSKQNPNAGSLEVTIKGLPSGTNADVVVSRQNGFSQQLTTSSVLSNLTPEDYQLTAKAVKVGSDNYTPTPTNQTVGVAAGSKTDFTVTYTKQSSTVGQLAVTVKGLPTSLIATATVIGPSGFSETLTASKTFENLPPGEYTVTASKVDGTYPYNPSPKTQTLNVVAGESANALLAYVPTIMEDKSGPEDSFSSSVAVDGDIMVVGAPGYDSPTQNSVGAAYLYRRAASGEWIFRKLLVPPFESTGARVGQSVAVSGDTVVVGAPRAITSQTCDSNGQNCTDIIRGGLAYVFKRNEGGGNNFGLAYEIGAFGAINPVRNEDDFGASVAVSDNGNVIAVGVPGLDYDVDGDGTLECDSSTLFEECSVGGAYVFFSDENSSGVALRLADDKDGGDNFGSAVAVSGNTVVVGARGDIYDADGDGTEECSDGNSSECFIGSAYVFEKTTNNFPEWEQVKKLFSNHGAAFDGFGETVAISEDTVVVGLSGDNDRSQTEVVAHVFQRNEGGREAWGEVKELSTKGVLRGDRLSSVAIYGNSVVVGIPYSSGDVNEDGTLDCRLSGTTYTGTECFPGTVAMFQRDQGGINNFGLVKTFVASDGANFDNLGLSVGISADTLVAGAPGHAGIGAVYVLEP